MILLLSLSCTSTWETQVSRELARHWEGPTEVLQFTEQVPGYTVFAVVQIDGRGQWRRYAPGLLDADQQAITDLPTAQALVLEAVPSGDAVPAAQAINRLRPSLQEPRAVFLEVDTQKGWGSLQPQPPSMDPDNTRLVYWSEMDPVQEVTVTRDGSRATLRTAP